MRCRCFLPTGRFQTAKSGEDPPRKRLRKNPQKEAELSPERLKERLQESHMHSFTSRSASSRS